MDTKPTKLRKIKTVCLRIEASEYFDKEVNEALADGWYLVKRYTVPGYNATEYTMLIAELQRYDDYDNE